MFTFKLYFSAIFLVDSPKTAIIILSCSKSGKLTNKDSIPIGLKKLTFGMEGFLDLIFLE